MIKKKKDSLKENEERITRRNYMRRLYEIFKNLGERKYAQLAKLLDHRGEI